MLPRKNRLTKRRDFTVVYSKGLYAVHNGITIKYLETGHPDTRIGFSISNSFSKKATQRNRMRRIFREACFSEICSLKQGFDIIVVIRPGYKGLDTASDLRQIFKKANLIIK